MKLKIVIGNTSQWPGPTISLQHPVLVIATSTACVASEVSQLTAISQASGLEDKILHLHLTNTGSNWCQDFLVAGEVSGTSSFVWLTLYEKSSPDTGMMADEAKAVYSGIQ